jgi:ubiquinone/menaquinone biosynthesis C-methylase UbiE
MTSEADSERLARIYSAQARAYAEHWSPIIRTAGERLLEALPWRGTKRVVDIGTGTGSHLADLRRLAPNAWILGVDRSSGMLELARPHGTPLALMDGMNLALRAESFDVAVMIFALFHFDDPIMALRGVRRILRPGGTLGIVTWAEDPDVEASRVWEAELDALGARDLEPIPRKHELMNTKKKVASLLSAAGLSAHTLWIERLAHAWDVESLCALHTGFGRSKRKLESLDEQTRVLFFERMRRRLTALPSEAFCYRGEAVCAVACRPDPRIVDGGSFTDIKRAGPPTTKNGSDWDVPLSAEPPREWIIAFHNDPGESSSVAISKGVMFQPGRLIFRSSPENVEHWIRYIDQWIARSNVSYWRWLR